MVLRVDPQGLRRFAGQLDELGDDATAARHYVDLYGRMSWDEEGWLALARAVHEPFVAALTQRLNQLHALAVDSATELMKAAGYHESTDRAVAARSDDAFPDQPRPMVAPL